MVATKKHLKKLDLCTNKSYSLFCLLETGYTETSF